jgi:hypothetical protein
MEPVKRIKSNDSGKADGIIKLDPPKTFWNLGMIVLAVFLAPLTFSLEAFFYSLS